MLQVIILKKTNHWKRNKVRIKKRIFCMRKSKNKQNPNNRESNKLDLRLFGEKLCVNESPTFLGIRFDRHLTFKNQISYLQDSCVNRLNFLKIVSKRSFGLSSDTLNSLYISIIRSVLEYSSIITPNMTTSSLNKLTIRQNKE